MSQRIVTDKHGLNQAYISSILDYNPRDGSFYWKYRPEKPKHVNSRFAGKTAGTYITSSSGIKYKQIMIDGVKYRAHRLAWVLCFGYWPDQIDHINGVGVDNRIDNLRDVSIGENNRNQKRHKTNKSGVSGVTWNKKLSKWHVRIKESKNSVHIGLYSDFNEACQARYAAEIKYGFHPNHGRR